jgi:hypothetical protein
MSGRPDARTSLDRRKNSHDAAAGCNEVGGVDTEGNLDNEEVSVGLDAFDRIRQGEQRCVSIRNCYERD